MNKLINPFDFPLANGTARSIEEVCQKLLQDFGQDGRARITALGLDLNTQVVIIVGNPGQMKEIVFKAITPLVQPGLILKGS